MPLPKNAQNDKARMDDRRAKVAALYLAGKSQQAIAGVVGVSQMTVSKDLAYLRAQWRANALRDFAAKQAEELAKIAHLERAAWEAWQRSCEAAETRHTRTELAARTRCAVKKGENQTGKRTSLVPVAVTHKRTTRGRGGDPRFLEEVIRCIEMRLKLLGVIDGPPVGVNAVAVNWDALVSKTQ